MQQSGVLKGGGQSDVEADVVGGKAKDNSSHRWSSMITRKFVDVLRQPRREQERFLKTICSGGVAHYTMAKVICGSKPNCKESCYHLVIEAPLSEND